jgi:hypothetical protein
MFWLGGFLGLEPRSIGIALAEGLHDCGRRAVPFWIIYTGICLTSEACVWVNINSSSFQDVKHAPSRSFKRTTGQLDASWARYLTRSDTPPDQELPRQVFSWFSSALPDEFRDGLLKTDELFFPPSPFQVTIQSTTVYNLFHVLVTTVYLV